MRVFLDSILLFLNMPTLSDEEFDGVTLMVAEVNKETFLELKRILEDRNSITSDIDRLSFYFKAKNVSLSDEDSETTRQTNILIGRAI